MTTAAIRVQGLRRSYGQGDRAFEAVRGVDLEVAHGTITALLGTNGAGKTSTMEVIEGLATGSAGTVRMLGLDPVADRDEVRRRSGVLLQNSGFSGDLTVSETIRMWGSTVSEPWDLDECLDLLDLRDRADVRVRGLSGGEQRRLDLTCTLMGSPAVILLDEPTTGLDPENRRGVWRLIRRLRDGGATILLTTHYLEEAEELADRLEIMHGGQIVRSGTPAEVVAGHPSTIRFLCSDRPAWLPDVPARRAVEDGETISLETDDLQRSLTELLARANADGLRLAGLEARSASLESVFLSIADQQVDTRTQPEGALR